MKEPSKICKANSSRIGKERFPGHLKELVVDSIFGSQECGNFVIVSIENAFGNVRFANSSIIRSDFASHLKELALQLLILGA